MTRYLFKKLAVAAVAALLLLDAASPADEKRISIYSAVATYTLPVFDRAGHEYVGLLEILEPLGRVSASAGAPRWKLTYNNVESEFVAGKTRIKVRGHDYDLPFPFLIENSRGLVPVSSLPGLLPRFLGNSVALHEGGRRLFIGDVAIPIRPQLERGSPTRLVFTFAAPVNPTIATEPGKLRMVFAREPVTWALNPIIAFENSPITDASFGEGNGAAELTVASTAPLMASFSNGGRTIVVSAAAAAPSATAPVASAPTDVSPKPPAEAPQVLLPQPSRPAPPRPLVVVDPAHGGNERGAALSDSLAEKTVTLGLARLLRHELEQQGFAVALLREGDETLTPDQRAGIANAAHAVVYIVLHAASQGSGVRVYYGMLPPDSAAKGPFRPWNAAQAAALPVSQSLAGAMVGSLQRHQLPARAFGAALRPLNNVMIPAAAVELAPGPGGIADLPSANYQQKAAAAIADAITAMRQRLGVQP